MPGPLDGYRVVEISEGVAGPYTAMSLGDAGADVIKIESPAGDRSRGWAPAVGDNSAAWHALNRNKRGIVLDWSNPADLDTARRLLQQADVAVVDKVGLPPALAWDALGADQLVYCAISGWGPNGPWSDREAGELAAQLAGEATASLGSIGEPPVRLGNDAGSMYAANYAIQGVCAALYARDVSGRGGQRLEVSLFGSLLAMRSTLWVALSNPDEWWGFHLDSYIKPPTTATSAPICPSTSRRPEWAATRSKASSISSTWPGSATTRSSPCSSATAPAAQDAGRTSSNTSGSVASPTGPPPR